MSYGWLTESALIPQPSKKIKVDNGSLVDLSVVLLSEKAKAQEKSGLPPKPKLKSLVDRKNKGIDARNQKDAEVKEKEAVDYKAKLEEKSQLYENLAKAETTIGKNFLVDFNRKKIENMTEEEKIKFEIEREKFYQSQEESAKALEKDILSGSTGNALSRVIDKQVSERESWEKEALREIEEGLTEEMIKKKRERVLVQQSYDKHLTEEEKGHLQTVIKEEKEEKVKAEDIKRKRSQILELRKEKLKKLTGENPDKTD